MKRSLHFFLLGIWITDGLGYPAATAANKEKYQNIYWQIA
jgi:hypothetical protein